MQTNVEQTGMAALESLADELRVLGDRVTGAKLLQLAGKLERKQLNLAFCGHFSAGKSSLINKLCGAAILPSSPIPTSANLVTIRSGEPGAEVIRRGDTEGAMVPLEQLSAYCINGDEIETVEIRYPVGWLGTKTVLMDTPGIDSTDEAHMAATESALHLADVVFYVMDYNHVQSEVNLTYVKKLKDRGKPVIVVVNQIDKHRAEELSFDSFKNSVEEAFRSWQCEPDGYFYISAKYDGHPCNEWRKLAGYLSALTGAGDALIETTALLAAARLGQDHADVHDRSRDQERAVWQAELQALASEGDNSAGGRQEDEGLAAELERLRRLPEDLFREGKRGVEYLLDNANVIPAFVRDLAASYLESRSPGFKAGGWFATKGKTEREREERLQRLHEAFFKETGAQIEWHLLDVLRKAAETAGLRGEPVEQKLAGLHEETGPDWLAGQVNPGAVFGNEYTMTYSRQLASEIKSVYRRKGLDALEAVSALARQASAARIGELERRLVRFEGRLRAERALADIERQEADYRRSLLRKLPPAPVAAASELLPDWRSVEPRDLQLGGAHGAGSGAARPAAPAPGGSEAASAATGSSADALAALRQSVGPLPASAPPALQPAAQGSATGLTDTVAGLRERARLASERLGRAAGLLHGVPGMGALARSMEEKQERLQSNRFTIALFGAFSAGKSSFANALIGEPALPVSPNPTTAAINKIVPPSEGALHGTAKVKMKTREAMLADVQYSIQALGLSATGQEDALLRIRELTPEGISGKGRPHYAFLKAVEKGWPEAEGKLGQELTVDREAYRLYAAEESRSCFVEEIELYYDCELTAQGIVLVDTPGADSINARHTDVAFNYIRNSDAVFFVTYYNHAFSQADRQFLNQLGLVKDSFELDKMFFILNAADLAGSDEERELVVNHLEQQLAKHGIRRPRIYPVSSLKALQGKQSSDGELLAESGLPVFQRDFIRFTMEELAGMALEAAGRDLQRAHDRFSRWLAEAAADAQAGEQAQARLLERCQAGAASLGHCGSDDYREQLAKEIAELHYYIGQRMGFRMTEWFQTAYNPASLREDAGSAAQALRACSHELAELIGKELSQELLATTLRAEKQLARLYSSFDKQLGAAIREHVPDYEAAEPAAPHAEPPELTGEFGKRLLPEERKVAGYYKNARQFFEGDGRDRLKRELEPWINGVLSELLGDSRVRMEDSYGRQLQDRLAELKARHLQQLEEYKAGKLALMEMKDLSVYQEKQGRLKELLYD